MTHLAADVLVVGAGGAGMYAAIAAAGKDASVLLLDKSLVGRGGATIMAQMTVAAAIGHEEPDHWTDHLQDTLAAGRELCDERLARMLCENGPARIFEMDGWGAHWARGADDRIRQVKAPGHGRARCCYVDFLNTGPGVAGTLRRQVSRLGSVRRVSNVAVTEIVVHDGRAVGAVGMDVVSGDVVTMDAKAVILAAGGLTKIYRRNSASTNMGGEAYALALWAGAELIDMEFVQFFPIAHLAPRLVGMDPIMWDPFRYKLGGRLLNGDFDEFMHRYGGQDSGTYTTVRDQASYAILKEVEAGRGSPHGGVYLDFRHVPDETLRGAFGPVIDRLAQNGIDLTRTPVEVAPTAHYHMGGIRVNHRMETRIAGLYAAGEAVGGANGANRLSGNAITEALVFGECAGREAATAVAGATSAWNPAAADGAVERLRAALSTDADGGVPANVLERGLQDIMWEDAGPFRTGEQLQRALDGIRELRASPVAARPADGFNLDLQDRLELRAMLTTAEAVVRAAIGRTESRGAHQRLDFQESDGRFVANQAVEMRGGEPMARWPDGEGLP